MKKLKMILATIITMVALLVSTCVFAYNGQDVDTHYQITMPTVLTEGAGVVTAPASFKYQFVETTAAKYSTLKKLEAQLALMQAYVAGEYANWEDAEANANYKAMVTKYETTYNETVASLYTTYGNFDSNSISDVRSLWIHELPDFVAGNWTNSTDNKISIDLTTFTGTKYYVAWVQVGDMYDAEVYILTGTKTEKTDPTPADPTPADPTPADPQKTTDNTSTTNTKNDSNNTYTSGTKTTSTSSKLPKAGAAQDIFVLAGVVVATIGAIVSYKKYRKIK